ncbi:hypothetical protein T265_08542 [Opisthorchis viverrini]|uniref:Uncharacterized protein n=1 Tax=Opisthorchis viverrini TaxID=6198 RepID=A0A075A805_OPIVI|nr:hypothetical protein T265_08542 [Opisthorchis viverrini]KER23599.1 hypothetical protein T265_08542 [Opisthorchis viverrini]
MSGRRVQELFIMICVLFTTSESRQIGLVPVALEHQGFRDYPLWLWFAHGEAPKPLFPNMAISKTPAEAQKGDPQMELTISKKR